MMYKFCIFVGLLFVVVPGLTTSDASEREERPGYCRDGDIYIKEGEQAGGPIGKCMRVRCINATVGYKKMSGVGCSTFVPRPGCHVSSYDNTKRYPACCPKEVCPDNYEDNVLDD